MIHTASNEPIPTLYEMKSNGTSSSKVLKVLVCGGAGYIGSHVVREMQRENLRQFTYDIVIVDNLSTGHAETIPKDVCFEKVDILDSLSLFNVFQRHRPDAVFHLCASIVVSESCIDPLSYYHNNVTGTLNLLRAMQEYKVKFFIFSSTAAVFGHPSHLPIQETHPYHPLNPYGETKRVIETCLKYCDQAYGLKYISLRYFNACGADQDGDLGELHPTETHIIPLLMQVALNELPCFSVYGQDYSTKDGTCIRDYIHVSDLAKAHLLSLKYLYHHQQSEVLNLGSGEGYSVMDLIQMTRELTNHPIPIQLCERRQGDPPSLIASSELAKQKLHWQPQYTTLKAMLSTAWVFHQRRKQQQQELLSFFSLHEKETQNEQNGGGRKDLESY